MLFAFSASPPELTTPKANHFTQEERRDQAVSSIQHWWRTTKEFQRVKGNGHESDILVSEIIATLKGVRDDCHVDYLKMRAAGMQAGFRDLGLGAAALTRPVYARDNPIRIFDEFMERADLPAVVPVNSKNVAHKIEHFKTGVVLIEEGGLCVIQSNELGLEDMVKYPELKQRHPWLFMLDCLPSPFRMLKCLNPIKEGPLAEPRGDARDVLEQLLNSQSFLKIRQKDNHLFFSIITALMENLSIQKNDKFTCVLLDQMQRILDFIANYDNLDKHYERAATLYEFINDLVFVFMAYNHPYTYEDYQRISADSIRKRNQALANCNVRCFPALSGMDAVATAYIAARKSGFGEHVLLEQLFNGGWGNSVYHEISKIFSQRCKYNGKDCNIWSFGLNTNCDFKSFIDLESKVRDRAQQGKLCLIIDTTLELQDGDPVRDLMSSIQDLIQSNQVTVFLCKSFQKFSSLGSAKIKAGNIALLSGNGSDFDTEYLEETGRTNFEDHDEQQMMTYYLGHADFELNWIGQVMQNLCALYDYSPYRCGPFLWNVPGYMLGAIPPRVDSFGFTTTTILNDSDFPRISVGLEPPTVLKRKFPFVKPVDRSRGAIIYDGARVSFDEWIKIKGLGEPYGSNNSDAIKDLLEGCADCIGDDRDVFVERGCLGQIYVAITDAEKLYIIAPYVLNQVLGDDRSDANILARKDELLGLSVLREECAINVQRAGRGFLERKSTAAQAGGPAAAAAAPRG